MTKTLAILAVAGLASTVLAQGNPLEKDYSITHVPPLVLPSVGVASSVIIVNDTGLIASMDYVFIDIDHTWSNDVVITLTHGNNVVNLLNRPPSGGDNLGGIYTFVDGGAAWPGDGAGDLVPPGTYRAVDLLSAFAGKPKQGDWILSYTDTIAGDGGQLRGWGFGVTNVPTPGAFALLGLGGLAAARRRRA